MITMLDTSLDPGARATRLAAEGRTALMKGDTGAATKCFSEAGRVLEQRVRGCRKTSEKHVIRYLAATQYYLAGSYAEALQLCNKIQRKLLPEHLRLGFVQFRQDVAERAGANYARSIEDRLIRHWEKQEYDRIITLLQEHPYILGEGDLAYLRADCCESLGQFDAAAIFFRDAIQKKP